MSHDQAMKNLRIIGAGLSCGVPVELTSLLCKPISYRKPERVLTERDKKRLAAAQENRDRRAAKRRAQQEQE